ncbi:MAG: FixH family protein [Glaciecola sp.]
MQEHDTTPWYKQFWPWFLIAIPFSSLIVGSQVIRLATDGTNSMVVDDYYKEGKTINARLDKIIAARDLNISTELFIKDGDIALTFLSGAPETGEALKLDFFHATQEAKDFAVFLSQDASGVYRYSDDFEVSGKWRIRLTPVDESWKVQQRIVLPQAQAIAFNP